MKKKVMIIMPRKIDAKGGGITRMVGYIYKEVCNNSDKIDISLFPTRLTDIFILRELSQIYMLLLFILRIGFSKCSIVHIHVAPRGSTSRKSIYARIAKKFKKKIILHLHGSGYDEFFRSSDAGRREKIKSFFQSADAVIVLGVGWREFMIRELCVDPSKVHIINNGVPDPGATAGQTGDVCQFIFVGTVGHRKGVDLLINAFAGLQNSQKWRLVICGGGEVVKYRSIARSLGLSEEEVLFTGWQDAPEVRKNMMASHVFILPSRAENQPIAIIEAMAIGIPAISTEVGDIPNQIEHGKTGVIVKVDDIEALQEAIILFLQDRALSVEMGNCARKKFLEEYTLEKNVRKTIDLYEIL